MQKHHHLLLADDDEDDRLLFMEVMSEIAPEKIITFVEDGNHLMEQLELVLPDILFLDLNMPKKSGFACLEEIRKQERFNSIAICIYSTSAEPSHINKAYSSGANIYIQKPTHYAAIKKLFIKVLTLNLNDFFPQPPRERFLLD